MVSKGLLEKILLLLFVFLTAWWFKIFFSMHLSDVRQDLVWAASYQSIAIFGSIAGLVIAKYWGGFKSVMGKALIFFSLGLLLQAFGQTTFSYYNLIAKVEIPYPSISDIGFFGSIIFYIYGAILLGRASGTGFSLKNYGSKAVAIIIPLVMLILSYAFFLQGYQYDPADKLKTFLDFGYPLGQAVYVSIAIMTYILSKNFLGGMMKKYVMFFLIALVIQYVAEYNFLSQASNGTWVNGGYGDYIYLLAYSAMALSLIKMKNALGQIQKS